MKGAHGASMGGVEKSPQRRKRETRRRRNQERSWAAKSGPVTTTVRCDCDADEACPACHGSGRRPIE